MCYTQHVLYYSIVNPPSVLETLNSFRTFVCSALFWQEWKKLNYAETYKIQHIQ